MNYQIQMDKQLKKLLKDVKFSNNTIIEVDDNSQNFHLKISIIQQ